MMKHIQIKKTLLQIKIVQKYLEECALNIYFFFKVAKIQIFEIREMWVEKWNLFSRI